MSLRLRVMQRDGWPRPILHTGVPGCEIACLILSSISLSVTTNHPPPPKHTSHQTSQIDVTHWCAIRPMHWVSNRAPPHEEWWLRAGVRAGTLKVTHIYMYICLPLLETDHSIGSKLYAFFLSVVPSFSSQSPSTPILDTPWSNGCF